MQHEKNPKSQELAEAISEETARFEEFYLWLEKSMPKIFFSEVKKEWISLIVHSLMGFKVQEYFSEIHLKNAAISITLDSKESDVRILESYPLFGIKSYTTYISRKPLPLNEGERFLKVAIIHFTEVIEKIEEPLPQEQATQLKNLVKKRNPQISDAIFDFLITKIDHSFLRKMHIERQAIAVEMFWRAQERDSCQYEVQYQEDWKEKETTSMHIILAWRNIPRHNFLYRLFRVIYQHDLVCSRVNAAYTDPYTTQSILMLSFGLHGASGESANTAANIPDFLQELVTLKYFGSLDLFDTTFVAPKILRGNLANFLRTAMNFINQVLLHDDPNLYSFENIEEGLCRHPELTVKLCEAFEYKFHPEKHDLNKYEKVRHEFLHLVKQLDTGNENLDNRRKNILLQGMNFVEHTLKCNFYRNSKTAFCFRLDPNYLNNTPFDRQKLFPEIPYAIFFMKGMHFLGFHIRFKDLARGGLRTIYPERKERMLAERNTIFSECYNLALTQHKKNKDIPEGGAKGVLFLKPNENLENEAKIYTNELIAAGFSHSVIEKKVEAFITSEKIEYLYQTQRSFISNFLTLINCKPDGSLKAKHIVDYYGKPEYIYLGPDENMHDTMISWIANESKRVGYIPGGAFISGKKELGINHKEYGVTSLGVNVYMHEVLKFLGIDPNKDIFTVKMSGGPDGDVAGNQIKNLYELYPHTAKLVALTDVSGTINDSEGLDLKTCYDLFKEGKSIRFYPPSKLKPNGFLLDRESRREPNPYVQQTLLWRNLNGKLIEDWISGNDMNALFRNNVHHTVADVFIPAGGRPKTLRDTNYKDFIQGGKPTSKAIIEGANLYLTSWARHYLEEAGVIIIKDSSANKCGVICSSYEILCSLALTDKEFLTNKEELVKDILALLKIRAYDEARLLLSEKKEKGGSLADISDAISKRINTFTDQLACYLHDITLTHNIHDPLIRCFLTYCPKTLREKFQSQLLEKIPENHKKAIIASSIASRVVYQRGLSWFPSIVDILPLLLSSPEFF